MTDTRPQTLPTALPPPSALGPPRGGGPVVPPRVADRLWGIPLVAASMTILAVIAFTALLPAQLVAEKQVADPENPQATVSEGTPYAIVPAAVEAVADRVSYADIDDVAVDTDLDGKVHFITISEPSQSVLGYWVSRPEPEIAFTTHREKYGTQTPSQRREISLQMMRTSGQNAQYVALLLAGYDVELVPGPVQIEAMLCLEVSGNTCSRFVDSAEQLDEGDTIRSVDGEPVENIEDLTAALSDNEPGDTVAITVDRIGAGEVTVDVELIASPDDPERPIIGFIPFDTSSVRLPFEITINTGQIGGPSAGLAFTLTLLDELTEGDLLGGVDVAVTGTIDVDGRVGAIGGLPQKASAVRQAGIDYLLVPASQADLAEAQGIAGDDVELIPVATVEEALAALERLGGDPVEIARPAGGPDQ